MAEKITPLEALDYLLDMAYGRKMIYDAFKLKEIISKRLKAFELIRHCCIVADYQGYGYEIAFCKKRIIEQEEYILLKEVL